MRGWYGIQSARRHRYFVNGHQALHRASDLSEQRIRSYI
jgi:hypothetical protein